MSSTRLSNRLICAVISLAVAPFLPASAFASNVTMQTPFGPVEIELYDEATPQTVANFLKYVNKGAYVNSFIHRSVLDFVVQGGGYTYVGPGAEPIPTDAPVKNEPGLPNVRGTIAMAKQPGDPDSATSQWFFNLEDNSSELDATNGGYTVFGQVTGDGMKVIDRIADLTVYNAGGPFAELPLIDYQQGDPVTTDNLVMIEIESEDGFAINAGLTDTWFFPGTDGQGFFIIVYPEIESVFLSWFTFDTERPGDTVTANLGDPGHRWLTAFGKYSGNKAVMDVSITRGGIFDSGTPAPVSETDGTITVEFSGCNSGTVAYDIPSIGRQDVVPIERVFADSINLASCENSSSTASFPVKVEKNEPTGSEKTQQ
jgi:cyclophilin family peptidyl-prolyl cis-trans isomerase